MQDPPPSSSPPIAKRAFKQRHVVLEESRKDNQGSGQGQSSAAISDSLLHMVLVEASDGWDLRYIAESGIMCLFCADLHWFSIEGVRTMLAAVVTGDSPLSMVAMVTN